MYYLSALPQSEIVFLQVLPRPVWPTGDGWEAQGQLEACEGAGHHPPPPGRQVLHQPPLWEVSKGSTRVQF